MRHKTLKRRNSALSSSATLTISRLSEPVHPALFFLVLDVGGFNMRCLIRCTILLALARLSGQSSFADKLDRVPDQAIFRIGSERLTHQGPVQGICLREDSKTLLSWGGHDKKVHLWDLETGNVLATLPGPFGSFSFSSAQRQFVALRDSSDLVFLNEKNLAQHASLLGTSLSQSIVSSKGDVLAVVEKGRLKLLHLPNNNFIREVSPKNDEFDLVSFSADGSCIAAATVEGKEIWLIAVADGSNRNKLGPFGSPVRAIAFSPEGKHVAITTLEGDVTIWDTGNGKLCCRKGIHFKYSADRSSHLPVVYISNALLATGDRDGLIRFWDQNLTELSQISAHLGYITALAVTPDGRKIFSAGIDHFIRCWDTTSKQEKTVIPRLPGPIRAIATNAESRSVAIAAGTVLTVWDSNTGRQIGTGLPFDFPILSASFSPDGRFLAAGTDHEQDSIAPYVTLRVWDRRTKSEALALGRGVPNIGAIPCMKLLGDKRIAYCELGDQSLFHVRSLEDGRDTTFTTPALSRFDMSPDGKWIVGAWHGPWLFVMDAKTGRRTQSLQAHMGPVVGIMFRPMDNRAVISAAADGTIKTWSITNDGQLIETASMNVGYSIKAFALSPRRDNVFAVGCESGEIVLWNLHLKRRVEELSGHSGCIVDLGFLDGQHLVSGSMDNTSILWKVRPNE
jgi:WD40 repeat protein